MKKAVVTVLGKDRVGIIAAVSVALAELNVNVLDISQTIVSEFFTMVMVVDASAASGPFAAIEAKLATVGQQLGMEIRIQRTEIFDAMHRL